MNAPVIWIIFPILMAAILYLFRRLERTIYLTGILVALGLAILAWIMPVDKVVPLYSFPRFVELKLASTLDIFGRQFIIDNSVRPVLALIYLAVFFWFGGAYTARTDRLFIPLVMLVAGLLTASLAVRPFLYAALIIEVVVLVCIPILSPPGQPINRGILRFLVYSTLGMPFLLLAGWLLNGVEANPGDPVLIGRVSILLGLGFIFFSSIFPFHTWIPMIVEEANPFSAAFVFFVLPGVVSLFALSFLEKYAWMRESVFIYTAIRTMGAMMIVSGGLWAIFQRNLGRIFGYAVVIEIGFSLMALSLVAQNDADITLLGIFFVQILVRMVCIGLWGESLSVLKNQGLDFRFHSVQGLIQCYPVVSISLTLALLSLAGFPLMAGFPVRVALWKALSGQSLLFASLTLLGGTGLLAAGLRSLAVLVMSRETATWRISETRPQIALLTVGSALLVFIGLVPQWYFPILTRIAQNFFTPGSP